MGLGEILVFVLPGMNAGPITASRERHECRWGDCERVVRGCSRHGERLTLFGGWGVVERYAMNSEAWLKA